MSEKAVSITVRIGSVERSFELWATNAPRSYDGFGTFTVRTGEGFRPERHVLIDKEHVTWQTQRYGSGSNVVKPFEAMMPESIVRWLTETLLKRLTIVPSDHSGVCPTCGVEGVEEVL